MTHYKVLKFPHHSALYGKRESKVIPIHATKAYKVSGGIDPLKSRMEASGQPHALAGLSLVKEPPVPIQ
jgi:hypothetical protein